jgi:hypothetical protein
LYSHPAVPEDFGLPGPALQAATCFPCGITRLASQIDKKLSMQIFECGPQIRGGFPILHLPISIFHSRAKWKIKNGKWEMANELLPRRDKYRAFILIAS